MIDYIVWGSIAFILYTYFFYPIIVCLVARLFGRVPTSRPDYEPFVSILISAYKSGDYLRQKLLSIMELNYPKEKIEVLVGLDGPDEQTQEMLVGISTIMPNLRFVVQEERLGKPSILNKLIALARGDVFVFTDARQRLDKDSVKRLISNLADDSIGAVSGELVFLDDEGEVKADIGLYWRYEKKIRECESRLFSMIGATGALYAMPRELVRPLPKDVILDDLWQPFNAIRKGKRVLFLTGAVVYDWVSKDEWREFQRKVRTLIGNLQLISMDGFFISFRNPILWQFLSHKIFRLFIPYAMVICYIGSIFMHWPWSGLLFSGQTAFYLVAILRMLGIGRGRLWSLPYTFLVLNLACVVAWVRFLQRNYSVKW